MRLLNTQTFQLELFPGSHVPPYAILSHTWGPDEVTLHEMLQAAHAPEEDMFLTQDRYRKLRGGCKIATSFGLDHLWVDTCCIDRSSSAELSEAINSMFSWYAHSAVCIAYLDDAHASSDQAETRANLVCSRWFTRGWTLQELVAPGEVVFYSRAWTRLGTRATLGAYVQQVTGIPVEVLESGLRRGPGPKPKPGSIRHSAPAPAPAPALALRSFSVAERMNWAARRETTRPEDVAYCLLGLFDINMPLLYGEGPQRAFRRLQEEIIKSTDDESIYAWRLPAHAARHRDFWSLLAESPAAFAVDGSGGPDDVHGLVPTRSKYASSPRSSSGLPPAPTNRGLHLELPLTPLPADPSGTIFLAFLNCELRRGQASINLSVLLQRASWDNEGHFVRVRPDFLVLSMMNNIVLPDDLLRILARDNDEKGAALPQTLAEAVPRPIFVPHEAPEVRYLKGIIFHPEMKSRDEAAADTSPYAVQVRSRSPTWQYFHDASKPPLAEGPSAAAESYEINFDHAPGPSVEDLTTPLVLGVLELGFDGVHGGSLPEGSCLVAGVEPLPPNPFGTAALYYVPWFAFETQPRVAQGDFDAVLDRARRRDHVRLVRVVRASIGLESRYSSLFYSISLTMEEKEARERSALWF